VTVEVGQVMQPDQHQALGSESPHLEWIAFGNFLVVTYATVSLHCRRRESAEQFGFCTLKTNCPNLNLQWNGGTAIANN